MQVLKATAWALTASERVAAINLLGCRGKRTGVFGAFLLAIWNDEVEEYQTISKIGTGFSEEQLKELADMLRPLSVPEPPSYYRSGPLLPLSSAPLLLSAALPPHARLVDSSSVGDNHGMLTALRWPC